MSSFDSKKTAGDVRSIVGGRGQGNQAGGPVIPCEQSITEAKNPQVVAGFLLQGEQNATPTADRVRLLGLRTTRELRHWVAAERSQGALNLSLPSVGYWLQAEGEERRREARMYLRFMSHRARNTARVEDAAALWLQQGGDE